MTRFRCQACGKTSSKALPCCQRCKITAYCNRECQKKDWKKHKDTCDATMKGQEKDPEMTAEQLTYGHRPGTFCQGDKGKRLKEMLPELIRQNYNRETLSDQQIANRASEMFTMWQTVGDTKYRQFDKLTKARQESLSEYFAMLVHNPGAPRHHSLYSDAEVLMEFYGVQGRDSARRYEMDGRGLIHLGAVEGLPHVIQWLVQHGVNPNQPTGYSQMGTTSMSAPLHLAIMHMRIDAIRELCAAAGIDVNQRNLSGKTPFHVLANQDCHRNPMALDEGRGTEETVQTAIDILMDAGADPYALVQNSWERSSGMQSPCVVAAEDGMNLADMANNHVIRRFCLSKGILPTGRRPPTGEDCVVS